MRRSNEEGWLLPKDMKRNQICNIMKYANTTQSLDSINGQTEKFDVWNMADLEKVL